MYNYNAKQLSELIIKSALIQKIYDIAANKLFEKRNCILIRTSGYRKTHILTDLWICG